MATKIDRLVDMVLTEAIEGHTHQCSSCGCTFANYEDVCPICGSEFITPLQKSEKLK